MRPLPDLIIMAQQERARLNYASPYHHPLIECLDALIELATRLQPPKANRRDYMRAYMAKYRARSK
jgi:hypothetical protein